MRNRRLPTSPGPMPGQTHEPPPRPSRVLVTRPGVPSAVSTSRLRRYVSGCGLVATLGILSALTGCVGEATPYFEDSSLAPVLTTVSAEGGAPAGVEQGLRGGQRVILEGEHLTGDGLSIRFGGQEATVLVDESTERRLVVLSPPGPIGGGVVDIVAATRRGITRLEAAYAYEWSDSFEFSSEWASAEILVDSDGRASAALAFWSAPLTGAATSLLNEGAGYFLSPEQVDPVMWEGTSSLPDWRSQARPLPSTFLHLDPATGQGPSLVLEADTLTASASSCQALTLQQPWTWTSESYLATLELADGSTTQARSLPVPPDITFPTPTDRSFEVNDRNVADINLETTLHFQRDPVVPPTGTEVIELLELLVDVPALSGGDSPYVRTRLVYRLDPEATDIILTPTQLAGLPEVDSTCYQVAGELERARLLGDDVTAGTLETEYVERGCGTPTTPLEPHPYRALMRLTRHYVTPMPIPDNAPLCGGNPCTEANLQVNLVRQWVQPVTLFTAPPPACNDGIDNDQDGYTDLEDLGCDSYLDESELDDSGALPCDDGIDNDLDGLIDFRPDGSGDPGCVWPGDDERGSGICDDGKDNDGDGFMDYRTDGKGDPGCSSANDQDEHNPSIICDDGIDNDGDLFSDWRSGGGGDPGCTSLLDTTEKDETGTYPCDDGKDNEGDGLVDTSDPGCRTNPEKEATSPFASDELNPLVECDNGVDDDRDGLIDYRKSGSGDDDCLDPNDPKEDR